jgi:hypothetical protein
VRAWFYSITYGPSPSPSPIPGNTVVPMVKWLRRCFNTAEIPSSIPGGDTSLYGVTDSIRAYGARDLGSTPSRGFKVQYALMVQRIAHKFPKLRIWVRFPVGV